MVIASDSKSSKHAMRWETVFIWGAEAARLGFLVMPLLFQPLSTPFFFDKVTLAEAFIEGSGCKQRQQRSNVFFMDLSLFPTKNILLLPPSHLKPSILSDAVLSFLNADINSDSKSDFSITNW